jgi:hypothetical protein
MVGRHSAFQETVALVGWQDSIRTKIGRRVGVMLGDWRVVDADVVGWQNPIRAAHAAFLSDQMSLRPDTEKRRHGSADGVLPSHDLPRASRC